MKLDEIPLEEDVKSRREVLRTYSDKDIILNDRRENWCHGRITDCSKSNSYSIRILDERGKIELFYKDLRVLLTIGGHNILPKHSWER